MCTTHRTRALRNVSPQGLKSFHLYTRRSAANDTDEQLPKERVLKLNITLKNNKNISCYNQTIGVIRR